MRRRMRKKSILTCGAKAGACKRIYAKLVFSTAEVDFLKVPIPVTEPWWLSWLECYTISSALPFDSKVDGLNPGAFYHKSNGIFFNAFAVGMPGDKSVSLSICGRFIFYSRMRSNSVLQEQSKSRS